MAPIHKVWSIRFIWGCWMFGFGAPIGDMLWVVAVGPVRLLAARKYVGRRDVE